ncbi:MAG: UvrD-helicase domain-containing protein, partial [Janthinobacterium lividum]
KQVDARKLHPRYYEGWLKLLQTWRDTPEQTAPSLSDIAWERLTPDGLARVCKEGAAMPVHPALEALAALRAQLAQLPDARRDALCHAAAWVAERFATEQERRAQMGFDDLLTRLDAALQGPNGARLAELVRQQFPVALIDEFQDTDPLQYRIFDAIYRVAQTPDDLALILIGDPKQAIYAFRGADIHTYLSARCDTAERHYTLGRNFRSTQAMVAATNHCFMQAERRAIGSGAFLFRRADENPLPFLPVAAEGRAARWRVDDADGAALTVWFHDEGGKTTKRGPYVQHFAQVCAGEIVRLLQLGQQGRAGFVSNVDADADAAAAALKPVQPGDIAVLVNTGKEAQAVRQALARGGVRSVYLSDKESVFESASAGELQRWLAACAEPDDDRLLRAALGTATLGMGWSELDHLNNDEIAWENRVVQFRDYRTCWRRQGVLPMLRRLLNDFAVPRRLLGAGNDRDLTDLLHLAELLQQASVVLDGEHALIRYLAEQRDAAGDEDDARKLRLESDAALVKVVTVHKSKGLEYPLVFLPFACSFRAVKAADLPLKWHDDAHRLHVALSADDASLAAADQERLGEDLRKLYVALTRARFATWIGVAPLDELERSALGYLLSGGAPIAPGTLAAVLQRFKGGAYGSSDGNDNGSSDDSGIDSGSGMGADANGEDDSGNHACAALNIVSAPWPTARRYRPAHADMPLARERLLRLPPREPWWIASYSSLEIGAHAAPWLPDAGREPDAGQRSDPNAALRPAAGLADDFAGDFADDPAADLALDFSADRALTQAAPLAGGIEPGAFGAPIPATAAQETFAESADRDVPQTDLPTPAARAEGLHAFPRGPNPGSFLHGLLEWVARTGFAAVHADPRDLDDLIARRCSLRGWTRWIEPLQAWLAHLLDEPLRLGPDAAVRLADLGGGGPGAGSGSGTYQVEMEFWFGVHAVDTRQLDRLVSRAMLDG